MDAQGVAAIIVAAVGAAVAGLVLVFKRMGLRLTARRSTRPPPQSTGREETGAHVLSSGAIARIEQDIAHLRAVIDHMLEVDRAHAVQRAGDRLLHESAARSAEMVEQLWTILQRLTNEVAALRREQRRLADAIVSQAAQRRE